MKFAIGGSIADLVTRGEKGLEKSIVNRSSEVLSIFYLLLYLEDFICKMYYNHLANVKWLILYTIGIYRDLHFVISDYHKIDISGKN